MRNPDGELYNAVEYICREGIARGVLPRSFIEGEYLHIYANRPGGFRLTRTESGSTNDTAAFLRDRRISPLGRQIGNQTIITRGQFWSALMDIHANENLFHDFSNEIAMFPDLIVGSRLNRQVMVGQNLDAFYLVGYRCGNFIETNPMRRHYFFKMLAGYIGAFHIEVNDMLPINTNIALPDNFESHWSFVAYEDLRRLNFIPYAPNNTTSIDLYAYVTLQEAQEILFLLITAGHAD